MLLRNVGLSPYCIVLQPIAADVRTLNPACSSYDYQEHSPLLRNESTGSGSRSKLWPL
jgi:hypothetical protein